MRADGAFIPFTETFDLSKLTTTVRGVGSMGEVMKVDLQAEIGSIVGRQVVKVGRSSGVTKGVIMSYAVEYNDEKGVCFFTDFLIVGENKQTFDLEGDSGSLILLTFENDEKPRPIGLIWGGTANRGRLKLRNEHGPENWTSGVDLGRLLEILQLDVITTDESLQGISFLLVVLYLFIVFCTLCFIVSGVLKRSSIRASLVSYSYMQDNNNSIYRVSWCLAAVFDF